MVKLLCSWKFDEVKFLQGVLIFGITIYVQTLVVKTRGPVFMTAFRPLSTIVAAIMGLFVLREAIYLGRYEIFFFDSLIWNSGLLSI